MQTSFASHLSYWCLEAFAIITASIHIILQITNLQSQLSEVKESSKLENQELLNQCEQNACILCTVCCTCESIHLAFVLTHTCTCTYLVNEVNSAHMHQLEEVLQLR